MRGLALPMLYFLIFAIIIAGMEAVFRLNTRELENSFITSLKNAYPDRDIEITVREQEETEYLCSSPANREHLEAAIESVKQGKIISFDTLESAIQSAEGQTGLR